MRGGLRVARILGINIYIDWSWIFIFLLVTWHLSASIFPNVHPEWGTILIIVISLSASLLFFASVLAHELAHAVMARIRGLPVQRITLFIFGGAADIGREPPTPLTEFLVAVVGPITSAVLGIVFLGSGLYMVDGSIISESGPAPAFASLSPLTTIFLWLGPINLLLAIFNMIPGFPLDGGRILRSILWAITRNLRKATRWATFAGQLVAWSFILIGVAMVFGFEVPFFGSGLLGGVWIAFIGWFLNNAATSSYQHAVVHSLLEGVTVERLMRSEARPVESYLSLSTLVYEHIIGADDHTYPVVDQDSLVGIVTLEDVRKVPREEWDLLRVRDVMTSSENLEVVNPREEVSEALDKLTRRDVRQIPVVQSGRLVGMLRQRDILHWLQLQSSPAENLR